MLEMCLTLSGLTYNAIKDLRTREISLAVTLVYGLSGLLHKIVCGTMNIEFLLCLVPGCIALFLSYATRDAVGLGDAWMLFALGCVLPWQEMQLVCYLAIGMAALVGLALCTLFHKKKEYEMPFVPFLLVACLVVLVGEAYGK